MRLGGCGEGLFRKSLRIVLRDGRLWAICSGGWVGGFCAVGYPPGLSVGLVVADSLMVGGEFGSYAGEVGLGVCDCMMRGELPGDVDG